MRRLYVICFVTLTTLFITCYCIGYYVIINGSRETEPAKDYYEARQVGTVDEPIVRRDTELIIEEYDIDSRTTESYTQVPSIEILGLDRAGYAGTLKRYLTNPSEEDAGKGLGSIDLIEFSSERIVVRKNYNPPDYSMTENFILYALDGQVVVYYEDFVTIYDYTDIEVKTLPIDLQREIYAGKQIKNLEELYEFLEDHTS